MSIKYKVYVVLNSLKVFELLEMQTVCDDTFIYHSMRYGVCKERFQRLNYVPSYKSKSPFNIIVIFVILFSVNYPICFSMDLSFDHLADGRVRQNLVPPINSFVT